MVDDKEFSRLHERVDLLLQALGRSPREKEKKHQGGEVCKETLCDTVSIIAVHLKYWYVPVHVHLHYSRHPHYLIVPHTATLVNAIYVPKTNRFHRHCIGHRHK